MMLTAKVGIASLGAAMPDEKIDLLGLGKAVANILRYEIKKAEKESKNPSEYIVEEYISDAMHTEWREIATYTNNLFAAIEYAKELSFGNVSNRYRVLYKKNNQSETVWHS